MDQPFQHSGAFRVRRFLNWFPLGLSYAFLYMGRYNLTVAKNVLGNNIMTKEAFGLIFGAGALTYGFAFLLNGPLTDKMGGKRAILIALGGSMVMNLLMGFYIRSLQLSAVPPDVDTATMVMSLLYAGNMYFQSFGAVAIVKVNSNWFHVRERGGFSGIFGTMISSGIFFAFTVNIWLLGLTTGWGPKGGKAAWWVFFAPAALLGTMFVVELFLLRDLPSQAGHEDFDTGDASSGDQEDYSPFQLIKRILTNPVIITVALIEFCTGVLRNGVMHWFPIYAKEVWVLPGNHFIRYGSWGNWMVTVLPFFLFSVGFFFGAFVLRKRGSKFGWATIAGALLFLIPFLQGGWGGILMVAGVLGGNIAGWISDIVFGSRRAPVAAILYGGLCVASIFMWLTMGGDTNTVGYTKKKNKLLRTGDQIVAVGEKKNLKNWREVSQAIACLPAKCEGKAKWDTKRCICSRRPKETKDKLVVNDMISLSIIRDGKAMALKIPDRHKVMRAGVTRKLAVGPKLTVDPLWLCLVVFFMSLCVIGTHGLLSGTATMDFGGRKGAATAVGVIDGFVYLGTAIQSVSLGFLTSYDWSLWPLFLLPFGIIGFLLLLRIWHAIPSGKKGGGH